MSSLVSGKIPEKNETQELNTSELKKKLKTQGKNSKLKGKTQFSGISEANKVLQSALKKAWLVVYGNARFDAADLPNLSPNQSI